MKNYRSISVATKEECLNSEYSYALSLDFEPTVKDLEKIRDLAKKSTLVLKRYQPAGEDSSLFESEKLNSIQKFNTLVFGDSGLTNINFLIKFYKPQETSTSSGDVIENLEVIVRVGSTVSGEIVEISSPSITIESSEVPEDRIGGRREQFKSPDEVIIKESYQKYTSRVSQLVEDQDMVLLMGECGVSDSKKTWGFWVKDFEDISGYEKFGLCLYSNDLCILKYNVSNQEYCISSLTISGPYGNHDYKLGEIDIPDKSTFYGIRGPNIIYTTEDYYWIYSMYNLGRYNNTGYRIKRIVNNFPNHLISSPWDIGALKFSNSYDIFNKLESLSSLEFFQERDEFLGMSGGKYKIKYGDNSEIYYFGSSGYVIDNTGNISWINDNLMMYREGSKIELVPKLYDVARLFKDGDRIIQVNEEDPNYYVQISLFDPQGTLKNEKRILLDGLRRKPWRKQFPDLDSIIPFRGLIFYRENDKLLLY